MALFLECVCSPDSSICILTQLVFHVDISRLQVGSIAAINYVTLSGASGPIVSMIDPADGAYDFDLPLSSTIADWGSLSVSLFMDSSTFQVPFPLYSQYEQFTAGYSMIQHYQCQNLITGSVTRTKILSNTENKGPLVKCQTGAETRGQVSGGPLMSLFYKSTPLGACLSGGIGTTDSIFIPVPQDNTTDIGDSGEICLCATGGSGEYVYSIVSGTLPCGITLNPTTGCLEGTANGDCPGTTAVTFRVTDTGGAGGSGSGGVTIGGQCRVFGSGATRISGGAWDASMVGNPITIAGNVYTVATVTPPNLLTVTGTIGIIDPTTWTYTSPVVPPPPPGPPETAEVTCGFIANCPGDDSSLGGNAAY